MKQGRSRKSRGSRSRSKEDTATVTTPLFTVHKHDARDLEALLAGHSSAKRPLLNATITSPPYADLKDYGEPRQIGWGQSYEKYVEEMRAVFATLERHTREDGCLWLIADTVGVRRDGSVGGLRPLPFDLATEAQAAGWTLRDVIVWHKERTLPWSNRGRLRNAFEYVLLLVKGPRFKYRLDRLRDPRHLKEWWVRYPERYNPAGKAPTNVWTIPIPVQGSWGNGDLEHVCPLPPELVERLVLLTTDEGDVVLDPFAGTGVVVAEAERLGRQGLGCEIVGESVDAFERVVRPTVLGRHTANGSGGNGHEALREAIVELRAVKYPRVVMDAVARQRATEGWPSLAISLKAPRTRAGTNGRTRIRVLFVMKGAKKVRERYAQAARRAAGMAPASKFGLDAEIEAIAPKELGCRLRGRRVYLYENGRTYCTSGSVRHGDLAEIAARLAADPIPPIVSDVRIELPRDGRDALAQLAAPTETGALN